MLLLLGTYTEMFRDKGHNDSNFHSSGSEKNNISYAHRKWCGKCQQLVSEGKGFLYEFIILNPQLFCKSKIMSRLKSTKERRIGPSRSDKTSSELENHLQLCALWDARSKESYVEVHDTASSIPQLPYL